MLYVLTLEPLEERYTEQWYRWFREELEAAGVPFEYIDGDQLRSYVKVGTVLDAVGTCYWKMTQLARVCKLFEDGKVKDGDKFFTMDLWHPGLEIIPYMAELCGIHVRVFGFLHAGSYYTEDFAEPMATWAKFFEVGWSRICEKIFVGSEYHKKLFLRARDAEAKIVVTGNPFKSSELAPYRVPLSEKKRQVIFPNRWDKEKRPAEFVYIARKMPDVQFVVTTSRRTLTNDPKLRWVAEVAAKLPNVTIYEGIRKADYYRLMAQSKVYLSTSIDETFGYCLVESLALGCYPVVRRGFSYCEILANDPRFFYEDLDEAIERIYEGLDCKETFEHLASYYDDSIKRMIAAME